MQISKKLFAAAFSIGAISISAPATASTWSYTAPTPTCTTEIICGAGQTRQIATFGTLSSSIDLSSSNLFISVFLPEDLTPDYLMYWQINGADKNFVDFSYDGSIGPFSISGDFWDALFAGVVVRGEDRGAIVYLAFDQNENIEYYFADSGLTGAPNDFGYNSIEGYSDGLIFSAEPGAWTRTSPPTVVPLPATLPLLLAGIGMLGFVGWRRAHAITPEQERQMHDL